MRTSCLIVEDEPPILRLVSAVLEDLGCETLRAPDAESALRLIEREKPDVVIADVRLPGMDGVELTRRIRSREELCGTPVLLMSAYGEPSNHDGDAFLPKPFEIDELEEFVRPYLDEGRAELQP